MQRRLASWTLGGLATLVLAACGGGGGDEEPPPVPGDPVTVTGTVRFERVPFRTLPAQGLDYANPQPQPARGVQVRALNASTQAVLASGSTNENGVYSLQVQGGTSIVVQVVAQMLRDTSQPVPRWDIRVQDGRGGSAQPYTYNTPAFDSSSGQRNINIPSGIGANGMATGTRASGPFAVLDTLYKSVQAVLTVEPQAVLAPLLVDWGSQDGGSYFAAQGNTQWIALNWNLAEDTEEFDEHVIAHEFGHYLEYNFSRSDSLGGEHALGDRLDLRVAFSEGFGYAFAAYALDDPVIRDSYVNNNQQAEARANVETNPVGSVGSGGCWCSESSVWSILWDIVDTASDGSDTLSLGFAPIWAAMKDDHAATPAVTSIFTFINGLKQARPGDAAAINALVNAQNIDASAIDDFASGETNAPFSNVLPLYTSISVGSPVVVRSVDAGGRHNKAGNHRLLRFVPPLSGEVTITVATSNPSADRDPDFVVLRSGTIVVEAGDPPAAAEAADVEVVAGQTYIIDAFDCANGCSGPQGTAGDYDLTVTIN